MSRIYLITAMIFMIIPQAFSSHEFLLGETNKGNIFRNRKDALVVKSEPTIREQSSVIPAWHEVELQEIELQKFERGFQQAFIDAKKNYNLLEMIKHLKLVYGKQIAFKSIAASYFRVREPEYLQYLMHCCKEVKEKEVEKDKELRKENKSLTYRETNPIIMEIIGKYTNWK